MVGTILLCFGVLVWWLVGYLLRRLGLRRWFVYLLVVLVLWITCGWVVWVICCCLLLMYGGLVID